MEGIPGLHNQDTRYKILQLLKFDDSKTVEELSQALEITSMGVRQHLLHMESEGLVHHRTESRGVGRPVYLYSLSEYGDELFPRTYAELAIDLLDTTQALDGKVGIDRILEKVTEGLEAQYQTRLAEKDLDEQVSELVNIRMEEGYMAEWERRSEDAFVLIEHNCAIFRVASRCRQFCHYEQELFHRVLGGLEVYRETHIISGDQKCTYIIQRKRS
jgi:predicted ArsR family transcriptional regulator